MAKRELVGMEQYGGWPNPKSAAQFDKKIDKIFKDIDVLRADGHMNKHNQSILDGMKATLTNMSHALHDQIDYILPL